MDFRSTRIWRLLLLGGVTALLSGLTIGIAAAHKFHSKNPFRFDQIKVVSPESAIFQGEVVVDGRISQDPVHNECAKRRLVKIIHRKVVIATDRTNRDGLFSAVGPVPPEADPVTAKLVKETVVDSSKHKHTCAGAKDTIDPNAPR